MITSTEDKRMVIDEKRKEVEVAMNKVIKKKKEEEEGG